MEGERFENGALEASEPVPRSHQPAPTRRLLHRRARLIAGVTLGLLAAAVLTRPLLAEKAGAPRTETAPVRRGTLVSSVSATGALEPVVTIQVGTQVSGTIQQLFATYNSVVEKGQVIAQIDRALFEARVEQTHGAYLAAQGALQSASAELTDARRVFERNRRLIEAGLVAHAELEAAEMRYLKAEAGVKSAQGSLLQSRGDQNQARLNLEYATIRSPVAGIVIGKNVDVGQTVAASFNTPTLFLIAEDLKTMEIDANIDEADMGQVRGGQLVTFTVDAHPDFRFHGVVSQVRHAPVINHNVVTYVVVVGVKNDQMLFEPGMTASVEIETARKAGAVYVPAAALRFKPKGDGFEVRRAGGDEEGRQVVYVQRSERCLDAIPVKTGISNHDFVEVLHGALSEGDRVVTRQIAESESTSNRSMTPAPPGPQF